MHVQFCGVRGSTPAPGAAFVRYGGHTSCVALTRSGDRAPALILDAGTGLREVTPLLAGRPFDGVILLSHLHWDHVQGLPFFGGGDTEGARVRVLLPEQEDGRGAEAHAARAQPPLIGRLLSGDVSDAGAARRQPRRRLQQQRGLANASRTDQMQMLQGVSG